MLNSRFRASIAGLAFVTAGIAPESYSQTEDTLTIYGLINKELRYVAQSEDAGKESSVAVTDVDGFESRIGVKGSQDGDFKISYVAEVGVNSGRDASSDYRIRPRIFKVDLDTKGYGVITIGQDWMPSALFYIKMDGLAATVAQNYNLDTSYVVGGLGYGSLQGLGYNFRAFRDQIRYASPTWNGLTYKLSYDTNGPHDYDGVQRNVEHFLQYTRDTLNVGLLYADCESCDADMKLPSIGLAANIKTAGGLAAGFNYGLQTIGHGTDENGDMEEIIVTRIFASFSYQKDENTYSLTYGNATLGDQDYIVALDETISANYKEASQQQIGLGYKNMITAKTALKLTIAQMSISADEPIVSDKKENVAQVVALGVQTGF
ncbi:porin [Pseudobacteriovorax antillogorgiicola]|uniref:Porin n=1 Tax=Pseudobacteriovorax antillogorgiicola TaxID=1513793 RepID=A0A1Y6BEY7_9BACT|nr:porin [Pseudobacteriovorax antillogorgiicola]TCS57433.1 porin-like protein [Pseudobacteriovorax antillogorgiicola]SMF01121.1 porin [Pseudobacteriovorax antillogorgiicola]